ncbi:MAG TPA: hypothetical protein VKA60_27245 [Blastocatellia bacterium]|nr:hypothetical protein [Blastocatellia bacterium]
MKAQRIFSTLIFTALVILSAASAQAQSRGVAELKKRIMAEIAAGTYRQAVEPVEAASLATEPSIMKEVSPLASFPKKQALVGTWDVIITFADGTPVKSTLQVFPGPADGEGSVIHASEFSFTPPNPTLPEQGSWQYTGGTQFVASYYGYSYAEDLSPFGKIGFRHLITVGANPDLFTGRAVFEVIDASGQVLFSDTVQTRGVRQRPLAP